MGIYNPSHNRIERGELTVEQELTPQGFEYRTTPRDIASIHLTPLGELIERQASDLAAMREVAAVWQIRTLSLDARSTVSVMGR